MNRIYPVDRLRYLHRRNIEVDDHRFLIASVSKSFTAALVMQEAVMALEIPSLPGVRLQTGIGITSGEVIAGNIGSRRRMHYAVVGDSVNIAARLQSSAGPGQVLVDEPTYAAVRDQVTSQDLGSLRLSGRGDWVRAYNVLSVDAPTG